MDFKKTFHKIAASPGGLAIYARRSNASVGSLYASVGISKTKRLLIQVYGGGNSVGYVHDVKSGKAYEIHLSSFPGAIKGICFDIGKWGDNTADLVVVNPRDPVKVTHFSKVERGYGLFQKFSSIFIENFDAETRKRFRLTRSVVRRSRKKYSLVGDGFFYELNLGDIKGAVEGDFYPIGAWFDERGAPLAVVLKADDLHEFLRIAVPTGEKEYEMVLSVGNVKGTDGKIFFLTENGEPGYFLPGDSRPSMMKRIGTLHRSDRKHFSEMPFLIDMIFPCSDGGYVLEAEKKKGKKKMVFLVRPREETYEIIRTPGKTDKKFVLMDNGNGTFLPVYRFSDDELSDMNGFPVGKVVGEPAMSLFTFVQDDGNNGVSLKRFVVELPGGSRAFGGKTIVGEKGGEEIFFYSRGGLVGMVNERTVTVKHPSRETPFYFRIDAPSPSISFSATVSHMKSSTERDFETGDEIVAHMENVVVGNFEGAVFRGVSVFLRNSGTEERRVFFVEIPKNEIPVDVTMTLEGGNVLLMVVSENESGECFCRTYLVNDDDPVRGSAERIDERKFPLADHGTFPRTIRNTVYTSVSEGNRIKGTVGLFMRDDGRMEEFRLSFDSELMKNVLEKREATYDRWVFVPYGKGTLHLTNVEVDDEISTIKTKWRFDLTGEEKELVLDVPRWWREEAGKDLHLGKGFAENFFVKTLSLLQSAGKNGLGYGNVLDMRQLFPFSSNLENSANPVPESYFSNHLCDG